jgi:hypothetical protein
MSRGIQLGDTTSRFAEAVDGGSPMDLRSQRFCPSLPLLAWLLLLLLLLLSACSITTSPGEDKVLGPPGKAKSAVIFVHGFAGGPDDTWRSLTTILRSDNRLSEVDIHLWGYPTQIVGKNLGVKQIAELLRTNYIVDLKKYDSIYFVAHSLGGIVVKYMILQELRAGRAESLSRIKHVVLLAVPQEGLQIPAIARYINRVAYDVNIESEIMNELRGDWINKVYAPKIRKGEENYKLAIPATVVVALQDQFIPEASVRAYFQDPPPLTVTGDHFSSCVEDMWTLEQGGLVRQSLTFARLAALSNQ